MTTSTTTSITIRNVPIETRDELARRAKRSGRSLQEYLRQELVEMARRADMDELMAQIEERKRRFPTRLSSEEIVDLIRADRGE